MQTIQTAPVQAPKNPMRTAASNTGGTKSTVQENAFRDMMKAIEQRAQEPAKTEPKPEAAAQSRPDTTVVEDAAKQNPQASTEPVDTNGKTEPLTQEEAEASKMQVISVEEALMQALRGEGGNLLMLFRLFMCSLNGDKGLEQFASLVDEQTKKGVENGLLMLAEFFGQNPGILPEQLIAALMPEQEVAISGGNAQGANPAVLQQLNELLTTMPQTVQTFLKELIQPILDRPEAQQKLASLITVLSGAEKSTSPVTVTVAQPAQETPLAKNPESQTQTGTSMTFLNQSDLREIRRQLVQTQEKPSEPVDIDALQKQVSQSAVQRQALTPIQPLTVQDVQTLFMKDAAQVLTQVRTGLENGLMLGKSEFVMKLSPKDLGEITVKLVEQGGRLTLSLAATNEQTQRLLSAELSQLRDTMRPLNVEVAPMEQKGSDLNRQMGQNFGGHQHGGEAQEQSRSFTGQAEKAELPEAQLLWEAAQTAASVPASVLRAYV